MSKGTRLARFAGLVGIAVLPLFAAEGQTQTQRQGQTKQESSCWMRDGAAPTNSLVYLICEQTALWTSPDGGKTWSSRDMAKDGRLRALTFVDANRGLSIGDGGLLLATEDAGKSWKPQDTGTKENLMDMTFVGESGWIVGFQGVILHSADGGRTWTKQKSGTTQTLESVYFVDATHGWTVGWAGTILRTSDAGEKWEPIRATDASWSLTAVYFRDTKDGWIVGFNGQILRSSDGGTTWKAQQSPVKAWLTSMAFDDAKRAWITYDDGLLVSEDGGETWKTVSVDGRYFLARLVRVGKELWAIGQSSVLRQDQGLKWKRIDSLNPRSMDME
jgi:photosystem II stability/assembly factor-like uncharacterized protein